MESFQNKYLHPKILCIETRDPGEIADRVPNWNQEYIQLTRGQYFWDNFIIQIGDFQFIEESFGAPTLVRGSIEKETYVIGLPQLCVGDNYYCCAEISLQTLLVTNHEAAFWLKTGEKLKHILMVAPVNDIFNFAEKARISFEHDDLLSLKVLLPNPIAYSYLSGYLSGLFSMAKSNPSPLLDSIFGRTMARLIISDTLPLFVDLLSTSTNLYIPLNNFRYEKIVKQMDIFVRNCIHQPITLQQMCEHAETSPRSLNYAFHAVYGLSPMAYLKILRLNQVRWALRKADPTTNRVMSIANRFGFWHMGQFGADYKKMFGETPATTLRLKN